MPVGLTTAGLCVGGPRLSQPAAQVVSKRWYQRWWVWVIIAFVALLIIGGVAGNPKNTKATRATTTTVAKSKAKAKTTSPTTAATTLPPTTTTQATVPPTTRASVPPTTRATVPPTTSPPPPTTVAAAGCYIDPEGNCYRAGEYCPNSLHGQTVEGESGRITCEDNNGWRWEPA